MDMNTTSLFSTSKHVTSHHLLSLRRPLLLVIFEADIYNALFCHYKVLILQRRSTFRFSLDLLTTASTGE